MSHHSCKRIALVGLGDRGSRHLHTLQTLEKEGRVAIVATVDVVQRHFELSVPFFFDYSDMLQACRPDIVLISAPNLFQPAMVAGALVAGADVIKEPPLALTLAQGIHLRELARQTNQKVFTLKPYACSLLWQLAREKSASLGRVCDFYYCCHQNQDQQSPSWDQSQRGGVWENLGWQALQQLGWLWGFSKINTRLSLARLTGSCTNASSVVVSSDLADGGVGEINLSYHRPSRQSLEVVFERGWLYLTSTELVISANGKVTQWQSSQTTADIEYLLLSHTLESLKMKAGSLQEDLQLLYLMESIRGS